MDPANPLPRLAQLSGRVEPGWQLRAKVRAVGVVSVIDVMEAIVGRLPESPAVKQARMVRRSDGSWLADGGMKLEDLRRRFSLSGLARTAHDGSLTVGEFVRRELGHVPATGEKLQANGWCLEVVDPTANVSTRSC